MRPAISKAWPAAPASEGRGRIVRSPSSCLRISRRARRASSRSRPSSCSNRDRIQPDDTVLLTTRDDELIEGQRRIEWMIDRLALMYLIHTPEIPEDFRDGAIATARRRYMNSLHELSRGRRQEHRERGPEGRNRNRRPGDNRPVNLITTSTTACRATEGPTNGTESRPERSVRGPYHFWYCMLVGKV